MLCSLDLTSGSTGLKDDNDRIHSIVLGGGMTVGCSAWCRGQRLGSLGSWDGCANGQNRGSEGVGFGISYK